MSTRIRHLRLAMLVAACAGMLCGCQSTESYQDENGNEIVRPEGGNPRRKPFHPTVPSEINRADYRYW